MKKKSEQYVGSVLMKKIGLLFFILHTLTMPAQIIYADYSDPDVCEGTAGD